MRVLLVENREFSFIGIDFFVSPESDTDYPQANIHDCDTKNGAKNIFHNIIMRQRREYFW